MVKIDPKLVSANWSLNVTQMEKRVTSNFLHKKDKTKYLSHKLLLLLQTC